MSSITKVEITEQSDQSNRTRRFRGPAGTSASADVVSRQAKITLLAFSAYDGRDDALAFLNEYAEELNGRPVDTAGADETGLAAATTLLHVRSTQAVAPMESRPMVRSGRGLLLSENYDLGIADA